jgi:YfiH family protein
MNAQVFGRVSIEGIQAVALSRHGGTSFAPFDSLNLAPYVGDSTENVSANLEIVRDLVSAKEISVMNAEHGNTVRVVTEPGVSLPGDGLITNQQGLALITLAADCVPFGLVDPVNGVIAVGHAGWRGVLANVMQSLLDEFVASGAQLNHTQSIIGPAICATCYEVPAERVEQFQEVRPEAIASTRNLDLVTGVKSVLATQVTQIHEISGCTFESSELFSYRRAAGEPTGRGGLVIALPTTS